MKHTSVAGLILLAACVPCALALGACGADESAASSPADSGVSADPVDSSSAQPDTGRCVKETLGGDLQPLELTLLLDTSSSMCFVRHEDDAGAPDAGDPDAGNLDAGEPDAGALDAGDLDAGDLDAGDGGAPNPFDNGHFDCTDPRSRWPAASQALRTFLSSANAAGLTVAVRTFGPVDSWSPPSLAGNRCEASDYETADYEATELPSESFANRIAAITPQTGHPDATQTQTGAVIHGATRYTAARRAALAGTKGVAMVLLTDGDPQGCDPSLPVPNYDTEVDDQLAYEAATAATAQGLKLYVVNIGGTKAVLDEIAKRGGTESAVTLEDPRDTAALLQALSGVRKKALSCTVNIPTDAGPVDTGRLDVVWTPRGTGGAEQILPHSADCANGRGWHYDDTNAPKTIQLCPEVCAEVIASDQGRLDLVVACAEPVEP